VRITFDLDANSDLDHIFAWIAKDNVVAAYETMSRIETLIGRLKMPGFEEMGRPGLVEGTCELIDDPYVVVYRVISQRDEILIVSVVHAAQDR
jgi:plasmid stabilization system protein ParE